MKRLRNISLSLLLLLSGICLQAQSTDEQLASQYYQNKEYDKALDYYAIIYGNTPQLYYTPYLKCLEETDNLKKAEKVARKQLKLFPNQLSCLVDLGAIYNKGEDNKRTKKTWEEAVKSVTNTDQTFIVANAFVVIQQYKFAEKTYFRGRRISETRYPFHFELAKIYRTQGKNVAMINEYLDALELADSYIQAVQNGLQLSFDHNANTEQNSLVKTELIKRIQRQPNKIVLSELLIWLQLQQQDFNGAYAQARAIDKRQQETGKRIVTLAEIFAKAKQYPIAIKAYQYVIDKGEYLPYYSIASIKKLDVQYQQIITDEKSSKEDMLELEEDFQKTIEKFGNSKNSASLYQNLAHFQAFYLDKTAEAIELLEKAKSLPFVSGQTQAAFKIELGDILLMSGDIWEASLLYSQVEKAFKHDKVGHEAKYKNAKVAYYANDFGWAQSQLKVLKGATSKLIANDALHLSLVISDALAIDTNIVPLELYARADLLSFQNKDEVAIATLDSIDTLFPNHALADDILYEKARIYLKTNDYKSAAIFYESILTNYSFDILADDALFYLAELNEIQFKEVEKAKEYYKQLLENHPGSLYIVAARKRFRALTEINLSGELKP